jgi:hypothetical protein
MNPLLRGSLLSSAIHTVADGLAQGVETGGEAYTRESYDVARSLRFGLVGLTLHGPWFGLGFPRVDAYFGASKSLANRVKKTLAVSPQRHLLSSAFPILTTTITTRWRSHLHFTFSRRLLQTWRPAAAFGTRISPY